ncbi:unnamed protein product [Rhodiola kirilowii]
MYLVFITLIDNMCKGKIFIGGHGLQGLLSSSSSSCS